MAQTSHQYKSPASNPDLSVVKYSKFNLQQLEVEQAKAKSLLDLPNELLLLIASKLPQLSLVQLGRTDNRLYQISNEELYKSPEWALEALGENLRRSKENRPEYRQAIEESFNKAMYTLTKPSSYIVPNDSRLKRSYKAWYRHNSWRDFIEGVNTLCQFPEILSDTLSTYSIYSGSPRIPYWFYHMISEQNAYMVESMASHDGLVGNIARTILLRSLSQILDHCDKAPTFSALHTQSSSGVAPTPGSLSGEEPRDGPEVDPTVSKERLHCYVQLSVAQLTS
jgi:hypothetical protein